MKDYAPQFDKPKSILPYIVGGILVLILIILLSSIDGPVCTDVIGGVCV